MRRVSVVGTTGSGKTTLARALAERLGVSATEIDALFWGPAWTAARRDELRVRVGAAAAADAWVIDGNYSASRDLVWSRADTVVWLDYPLPLILFRLLRRIVARIRSGAELWPGTGNRETFRNAFLSTDSLFVWALRTHFVRRRRYFAALLRPENAHLEVHRFRRPAEAARWLRAAGSSSPRV
ncbi:MAG: AAA family ATPase [Candidatus Limnocylindria bacterium]